MFNRLALAITKRETVFAVLGAVIVLGTYILKDNLLDRWKADAAKIIENEARFRSDTAQSQTKNNTEVSLYEASKQQATYSGLYQIGRDFAFRKSFVLERLGNLDYLLESPGTSEDLKHDSSDLRSGLVNLELRYTDKPIASFANFSEATTQLYKDKDTEEALELASVERLNEVVQHDRLMASRASLWINVLFGIGWVLSLLPNLAKLLQPSGTDVTAGSNTTPRPRLHPTLRGKPGDVHHVSAIGGDL